MDSMISSAPRTEPRAARRDPVFAGPDLVSGPGDGAGQRLERKSNSAHSAAGFTLAEVLIASTLSAFVLAAVMSSFVFLGRTGFRTSSLSELEAEVRRGLETFAEEARLARDVRWNSAQSVTLILPPGSRTTIVTYGYDPDAGSATHRAFYRVEGAADSTAPRRPLIRNLADDFTFKRYRLETAAGTTNAAANDIETKQLQVVLRAQRTAGTSVTTAQAITSSRYILRNKRVSN